MRLNNNDIEVRLQHTICCLASKSDCLIQNYNLGNDCADVFMKEFAIIDSMFLAIENYEAQEVPAHALITFTGGNFGSATVLVGATQIGTATWTAGTADIAEDLSDDINLNTGTTGFSATHYGATVVIYAPEGNGSSYNGTAITVNLAGNVTATTDNFDGGIDGLIADDMGDNCLTESQVEDMFEYIGKWCGICFAPAGSTYSNATTGTSYRLSEDNKTRITEDGLQRLTE